MTVNDDPVDPVDPVDRTPRLSLLNMLQIVSFLRQIENLAPSQSSWNEMSSRIRDPVEGQRYLVGRLSILLGDNGEDGEEGEGEGEDSENGPKYMGDYVLTLVNGEWVPRVYWYTSIEGPPEVCEENLCLEMLDLFINSLGNE